MAKKIGIRTLAEGVETEEQLEFLREIGCEKLQGYYIGRPGPYHESIAHCKEQGFRFESPAKRRYNDDLGYVNLLSHNALPFIGLNVRKDEEGALAFPLSIVEMVGERVEILYVNHSFKEELEAFHGLSVSGVESLINNKAEKMYALIRRFLSELSEGRKEDLDTIEGGAYCTLRGKEISHIPGRNAYLLNIQVYQGDFLKLKQKKMMERVKDLYNGYELVLLWSPGIGKNELLYERESGGLSPENKDFLSEYAKNTFSGEERKRFFHFLRKNNMLKKEDEVREEAFVGRDGQGRKRVFLVCLKPSALEEGGKILLSVRRIWNFGISQVLAKELSGTKQKKNA